MGKYHDFITISVISKSMFISCYLKNRINNIVKE